MLITVNGEAKDVPEGTTLEGLLRLLSLAPERLAVEFNLEVLRRAEWAATTLKDGDRVEIVHFVGGGGDSTPGERGRSRSYGLALPSSRCQV